MEIKANSNQYSKSVSFTKNGITLIIQKFNNEYIRIETSPHNQATSFEINLSNHDMTEWEVLESFQDLLQSLIGAYFLYPGTDRIVVEPESQFLAFKSDSCNPNILKIDYQPFATGLTITIHKNPKHYYNNNCIILHRDGTPFGSYFECFSNFIEKYQQKQKVYQKKS